VFLLSYLILSAALIVSVVRRSIAERRSHRFPGISSREV
jgi:hypothetical protein